LRDDSRISNTKSLTATRVEFDFGVDGRGMGGFCRTET
jgi:hypothetical protein